MIVCICRRVSDRDIQSAAHAGCASFGALQQQLGVATACGACGDCAHRVFAQACAGPVEPVHGRGAVSAGAGTPHRIVRIGTAA